jgi:hypothetical protein
MAARIVPYGIWKSQSQYGWCIIAEGESDCWAAWKHGVPCIGLPGSASTSPLLLEHVAQFAKLYVHSEPDKAGREFPGNVAARLVEIGWAGELAVITLDHVTRRNGSRVKDISDLHILAPSNVNRWIGQAIAAAQPLPPRAAVTHHVRAASETHYQHTDDTADWHAFLDGVDLEALINAEIGHRAGSKKRWCCPFHNDDDIKPDFGIFRRNGRQYWKCHSGQCGKGGDAAKFIQELRRLTFSEAMNYLGFLRRKPADIQAMGGEGRTKSDTIGGLQCGISLYKEPYREIPHWNPLDERKSVRPTPSQNKGEEKNDVVRMLDEFHTVPTFKKKLSPCRRAKVPMRNVDEKYQEPIFAFPCWRRTGCDICSPIWVENRVGWFSEIITQWDAAYAIATPDDTIAANVVHAIVAARKDGKPAFYIRIPITGGTFVISNHSHPLTRKLDNAGEPNLDPQSVLAKSIDEATREVHPTHKDRYRNITASRSIAYHDERVKGGGQYEFNSSLANHPRYDPRKPLEELAADIAGDPKYEHYGVASREMYTVAMLRRIPVLLDDWKKV